MKTLSLLTLILSIFTTLGAHGHEEKLTKFSLEKLGPVFNEADIAPKKLEELMLTRQVKLKKHRFLGHMAFGFMGLSAISAIWGSSKMKSKYNYKGKGYNGPYAKSDVKYMYPHVVFAVGALATYSMAAYNAMTAPKPSMFKYDVKRGWHKNMAYVHLPAMLIGPILGGIVLYKRGQGENVSSSLTNAHGGTMLLGTAAAGVAFTLMTIDFP